MSFCSLSAKAWAFVAISLCATGAEAQTAATAESVDLGNGLTMSFLRVQAGTFRQGSPETEPGRSGDESQRDVTLTLPFYIGQFPVTVGQFARFVDETRYRTEAEVGTSGGYGWDGTKLVQRKDFSWRNPGFPQAEEHPVVLVTYPDAEAFAAWVSRKAGRKFQLPTEAQWEYACRAGTTGAFPFGESRQEAEKSIWHKANSGTGTQPVDRTGPNRWGIHDMLGQVWEWCQDVYAPYSPGPVTDPVALQPVPGERARRVLRGGSWLKELDSCRSATRYRNDPRSRNADNGFRLVTLDQPAIAVPKGAPGVATSAQPRLEREDHEARVPPGVAPRVAPRVETRAAKKGVGWFGLVLGFGILLFIVKVVRALSRSNFARPDSVSSLLGGAAAAAQGRGPVSTSIVEDGFWIHSNALPAGSLVTCHYTAAGTTQKIDVRYEPGAEGHFVYTGSRPQSVSVVVPPGGGPTQSGGLSPPLFQRRIDDDDDDDRRFRGFPRAY